MAIKSIVAFRAVLILKKVFRGDLVLAFSLKISIPFLKSSTI